MEPTESKELIKRARAGDREARNRLVEENVGLVWNIVKRFGGRGYDLEDLFQIGCIGLMKSIDHFDLEYGVKFSTYACPVIMGEVKRFLRDDGLIKVSRTIKENGWKIQRAAQKLNQDLGRAATLDEIAAATELEPEEIAVAIEANKEVESIYRPFCSSEGKALCLIDQILQGEGGSVGYVSKISAAMRNRGETDSGLDREKERVLNKILLEQLLEKLEQKERQLIELRYFQEMTQTETARKLGISQVQVSRLEKKILIRLRKMAV
jgi:RNA polymerase sporulation-specific sigma factor